MKISATKTQAIITQPFFRVPKVLVFGIMFVASMIAGSKLQAQNEDAPEKKGSYQEPGINQHGSQNDDDPMGKRPGPPPEVKTEPQILAEDISSMLSERLSLSAEQRSGVYDAVLDYASTHNRSNFDHSELDRKIEKVLTNEQIVKYREFIKNGPDRNAHHHHEHDDKPVK